MQYNRGNVSRDTMPHFHVEGLVDRPHVMTFQAISTGASYASVLSVHHR
jgi:hypothetical protein